METWWHQKLSSKRKTHINSRPKCSSSAQKLINSRYFSISKKFHNQPQFHFHCQFHETGKAENRALWKMFSTPSSHPNDFERRKTADKGNLLSRTNTFPFETLSYRFSSHRHIYVRAVGWLSMEKLFFCIIASIELKIVSDLATETKVLSDVLCNQLINQTFSTTFLESGSFEKVGEQTTDGGSK